MTMKYPAVSIFMTIRNEAQDLAACVERVVNQDYPGEWEFIIAVGPSDDNTEQIARDISQNDPRIKIVSNPTGLTPQGLNLAVQGAKHDYFIRIDGHALIAPDYVGKIMRLFETTDAANVGGSMVPVGESPTASAVAHAMSSRFGIGGAAFHTGGAAGPQPTVYLGAFRRAAFEQVGGYDEYFARAQDWELNYRLRRAGHLIWFDPEIATRYHPRASWSAFAKQQFRTGGWRRRVISRHKDTWSLRYLAPPTALLAILISTVIGLFGFAVPALFAAFGVPLLYVLGVSIIGFADSRHLPWSTRIRVPLAMGIMHMSWGAGFLLKAK